MKKNKSLLNSSLLLLLLVFLSTDVCATRHYVNNSATTGSNNGFSWIDAYKNLDSAISVAMMGDTIWVAAGTYKPSIYPAGATGSSRSARDYSFYLAGGVHLFGGFAGTETTLAARDYATNVTILSGDIGTVNDTSDNCYHVVLSVNESTAGTLDGFTVTRGNASGSGSFTVNGNTVSRIRGGGMFNRFSSPIVTNTIFSENTASKYGGGMYNNYYSAPTITTTTFSENTADYGGGMYNRNFSSPIVATTTFSENTADNDGGGMYNEKSSTIVTNTTFSKNNAYNGGGMYNLDSSPTITNTTFSENTADNDGGGMYNYGSSPIVTNTTFSENTADNDGGGMYNTSFSSPTIANTIFWGNEKGTSATSTSDSDINNSSTSTPTITYTALQVAYTGMSTSNSTADPLFTDASNPAGADGIHRTADDGLHLFYNSPAANTGNNDSISGITDIIGSARIQDTTVNRGAYEDLKGRLLHVDSSATTGSNTGSSWINAYISLQSAISSAVSGDTIWVAAGTYKPSAYPAGATGSSTRDYSFYLAGGVHMYGGFAGTETTLAARDYANHETILSGDIGTTNDTSDNCYHVVVSVNDSTAGTLDGFTVTRGNATATGYLIVNTDTIYKSNGGGMYNYSSDPIITNTTFSENNADNGGGMYNNSSSSPTIANVTFSANTATRGGGMYNSSSSPTITTTTFNENTAKYGGGMDNYSSSPAIANVTFSANTATYYGGGMFNRYSSSPKIANVTFSANTASSSGGGMYNWSSSPTITNTTFSENTAADGGGMRNYLSSSPIISNSIFWGNKKVNSATAAGSDIENAVSSTPTITYTSLQVAYTGMSTSNSTADPLFVDASNPAGADGIHRTADDGLRFFSNSPAANTGNNDSISGITTDIIGSARIQNTTVNRGAYEDLAPSRLLVDSSATTGLNNGSSWTNAYVNLDSAISVAVSGDSIWVAEGTYKPSIYPAGASGSTDRDWSFYLKGGVYMYGGFAGTETTLAARADTNVTILSGDISTINDSTDNCYHVVLSVNDSAAAGTLDGFTVTGGNADGNGSILVNTKTVYRSNGGGMYNDSSSPIVTNTTFSENTAYSSGGGMYNESSSPTITNTTFSENTAADGGGMYNNESSPTISITTFSKNTATYSGGGMFNYGSSPTITTTTFSENTATGNGGGMYNYDFPSTFNGPFTNITSPPKVTTTTFSKNTAYEGGGMYNYSSSPIVINTAFSKNTATYNGGGMYNNSSSDPTIANTTFSKNTAYEGGGMYNNESSPTITNATFSQDTATGNGGGMYNMASSPTITNSIFWGNKKGVSMAGTTISDSDIENSSTSPISTPVITYTTLQVTYSGMNTSNDIFDPLFVDASNSAGADGIHRTADDGLRLLSSSPAANTGNNSSIPSGITTDIIGSARTQNTTVNRGAYEDLKGFLLYVDSSATLGDSSGVSWANAYINLDSAILVAVSGDTIWVAAGTYKPSIYPAGASGSSTRGYSFYLAGGVHIYGGFAGTETTLAARDYATNVTILSGDIGTVNDSTDNCYHVVLSVNESTVGTLDGFTVTGGTATGTLTLTVNGKAVVRSGGGGMFNYESSPTITNTTFSENTAANRGGGMLNESSLTTITNTMFSENTANYGGGMYNSSSSPTITNTIFSDNTSIYNGGGMYNSSSSPIVTNTTFSENTANSRAGGMYNNSSSSPKITNTAFSENTASDGGGMYNESSSPTITNTTFSKNTASDEGGGILNYSSSDPTIINTTFSENTASDGGGMYNEGSSPIIANSILWGNIKGNSATTSGCDIENSSNTSTPIITYTTLQVAYAGMSTSNNNTTDPLFVDDSNPAGTDGIHRTADDGLRLFSNSPAANTGNNGSIPSGITTDIIGSARIQDTTVDRGAYEDLQTFVLPVELIHFTAQAAAHTTAELTWATATEIDNSHFMIERSYDGEHFEEVARVEGNGNSSEVLHYAYTDISIAKGTQVVYYRLHQFDYNGVSEYSDVRRVTFGMNNQDEQNIAIYPNPFTSDVYIDCSTLSGGEATITVTNINGQQLLERSINTTEQIEKVDLSSLTKGMYFVNVTSDIGTTIVKVIKR